MPGFQPDSLPYNTAPYYWIAVKGEAAAELALTAQGFHPQEDGVYVTRVPCPWYDAWKMLEDMVDTQPVSQEGEQAVKIAVIPAQEEPARAVIEQNLKSVAEIKDIASSLWLGDALLADRVMCYLQPVQDRRGKVFGYESFARVQIDGQVIGGGPIFVASKVLKLEYRLDRYLHQKAVEAFVESEADNRLFINFQSGFIHRPEVYLEGLNHVVKKYNVSPRNIVLDFTQSQSQHNAQHLKSICQYCRHQGYSIALDDITSPKALESLLLVVQPDFIKLDMEITKDAADPKTHALIQQIVEMAHQNGVSVIAEGIEAKDIYDILATADVDLFQGYYIGKPAPVVAKVRAARA